MAANGPLPGDHEQGDAPVRDPPPLNPPSAAIFMPEGRPEFIDLHRLEI